MAERHALSSITQASLMTIYHPDVLSHSEIQSHRLPFLLRSILYISPTTRF